MDHAKHTAFRAEMIDNAPMQYAPQNELGVVFLFSHLAKKFRLKVEQIKPGYPDCIAYQKTGTGEKRVRTEFEYKSRNFYGHQHKAKDCDWLVCWEHNWPGIPKKLRVVELRRFYGLGFNVWIQGVRGEYKKQLWKSSSTWWNVPGNAVKGDLILYYSTAPESFIKDIFVLRSDPSPYKSNWQDRVQKGAWKREVDTQARISRVCRLQAPLFLEDMRRDRVLSTASFVRNSLQGRPNATEYWPHLYDRIIGRNQAMKDKLKRYSPSSLGGIWK